jgi:hypothetical protein
MVAVLALVVVTLVVGSSALALFLRSYGREEARHEAVLLDPQTPTVAYAIPNGVDPVVFQTALTHAGYTTMVPGGPRLRSRGSAGIWPARL